MLFKNVYRFFTKAFEAFIFIIILLRKTYEYQMIRHIL